MAAPSTSKTTAMLFALTSPSPSIPVDDFNKWYDDRHAPSRAACPGVRSVSRFHIVDGRDGTLRTGDWDWLAMYELEGEDALQTKEYKQAREDDGDDESRMFDVLSRRVYKLLDDRRTSDYAEVVGSGKSRLMLMTGLRSDSGGTSAASLDEYTEKHVPEHAEKLCENERWLRTSVWHLRSAADPRDWTEQLDVPNVLTLHEFEDRPDVDASDVLHADLHSRSDDVSIVEQALWRLRRQF